MTFFSRHNSAPRQPSQVRFDRTRGVIGTQQGDTTVLLDVNGGMYYTLNEVGGRIWALLGDGLAVPGIVERLRLEYDVPVERLDADVRTLIERLRITKLIEPAPQ